MSKWYSIKAAGTSAEISIYDEIGGWGISAKEFADDLKALKGIKDITLRINSPGGSVFDGMAIFNLIKAHDAQITVMVDGLAASMASIIAMAGDLIVMPENSMMMIHNPWTMAWGDAAELRKNAELLDKIKSAMISAYVNKTGLSEDEIATYMDEETWLTGKEAVELGFADESTEPVEMAAKFDLSKFVNTPQIFKVSATADNPRSKKETPMPDPINPAVDPADIEKAKAEAVATERKRVSDINAVFEKFPQHQELANKCVLDGNCTVEDAQAKLLDQLGKDETPTGGGSVTITATGREQFVADATDALIARAGKNSMFKGNTRKTPNPLNGYTARELARLCAERAGVNTASMDPYSFVAAAFTQTTSDFPILLENAMHKVLQQAYATQLDTWRRFCAVGSVSDFRAHNRYRTGSIGNLDDLLESGEFKNKAIPDGEKAAITAGTKGNLINLTRQSIINDDLGAFLTLASALGRAANRTIEAGVYAELALNSGLGPTMSDSLTLFHANHGNIGSGAALSVAALDADRVLMASQQDVGGNDYLDLRPSVLVLPVGLGGDARVINDAQYDPDTANKLQKPNKVRGLVNDIVDTPRLTGTRRYMFADPMVAPVLEVAFLDGNESPFLDSEEGFTMDGVRWKVRIDYGIAAIDYRGAVTDAGA